MTVIISIARICVSVFTIAFILKVWHDRRKEN